MSDTPRLWKVDKENANYWIVNADKTKGFIARVIGHFEEDTEAKARLIAAAPDMLKLLKEITFRAHLQPEDQHLEDDALALISEIESE